MPAQPSARHRDPIFKRGRLFAHELGILPTDVLSSLRVSDTAPLSRQAAERSPHRCVTLNMRNDRPAIPVSWISVPRNQISPILVEQLAARTASTRSADAARWDHERTICAARPSVQCIRRNAAPR